MLLLLSLAGLRTVSLAVSVINEVAAEEDVHDVKTQKPVSLTDNKCHEECVENLENPKPQVIDNGFFPA